ncbi:helix-turn-helix domain-containing protein [Variovorax paradoxus]|nr:helix-turn-helix domain-containing protein [Variovorax paradoxus]
MHKVWILLFPKFSLVDVSGMLAVFEAANAWLQEENNVAGYAVRLASVAGGPIDSSSGVALSTGALPHRLANGANTLFVAGEWGAGSAPDQPVNAMHLREWLVNNRRHLSRCAILSAKASPLMPDILTAARRRRPGRRDTMPGGTKARGPWTTDSADRDWQIIALGQGIDLTLSWVEEDQGMAFTGTLASRLPHPRSGRYGVKHYRSVLIERPASDPRIAELHLWIATHLREKLSVARLAQRVHMSSRSFARFYSRATGFTPGQGMQQIRLDTACRLIETSNRPLKAIAAQCGYGSQEVMRRAFLRLLGITPLAYKRRQR